MTVKKCVAASQKDYVICKIYIFFQHALPSIADNNCLILYIKPL